MGALPRLAGLGIGLGLWGVVVLAGCNQDVGDAGCQISRQIVIPESPLALMPNARIDRVGGGFVILGSDDSAIRWVRLGTNGVLGAEQVFALPAGAIRTNFAVAGVDNPVDRVLVLQLEPSPSGAERSVRAWSIPADGGSQATLGPPLFTVGGGPSAGPTFAFGSSRSGWHAGLAWIDPDTDVVMLATLDGDGKLVNPPAQVDATPADHHTCLTFEAGRESLSDELTLTYLRFPVDSAEPPTWVMIEASEGGAVSRRLDLNVAQPGAGMSCARGTPFAYSPGLCTAPEPHRCTGHAIVWQDVAGSWLTIFDRRVDRLKNIPFAAATDFGGPALQPPLVGLAAFGSDFGVLMARPRSVELWRLDEAGVRRPGALIFPSLAGEIGPVSAVPAGGVLTATYADYMEAPDPTPSGRRVVADAVCH